MRRATAGDEAQVSDVSAFEDSDTPAASPEPFFDREMDEGSHSMGSHWQPFFDDARTVLQKLPEILNGANVHGGYSQFYPPPERVEQAWPRGALLLASSEAIANVMGFENKRHRWDGQTPWRSPGGALEETPERAQGASARESGVAALLRVATEADKANMISSLFPYSFHGIEHTVVLRRVRVWENGLEAQIEAALDETSITFYDIDFVNNRGWYRRGLRCQFVLVGIAYRASIAEVKKFTIARTPEWFESMKWLTGEDRTPESGALEEHYSTEGMSTLLPIDDWDIDDYTFRGPVKDVWGMSILGLRAWRVRITAMRPSGSDSDGVDLDIIITERAWTGEGPPKVGQELEGEMWLQGRLWST